MNTNYDLNEPMYLIKMYSNNQCINRFISNTIPLDFDNFIFDRINIKQINSWF